MKDPRDDEHDGFPAGDADAERPGNENGAGEAQDAPDEDYELADMEVPSEALEKMPQIPDLLHSAYEEAPFSKCNVCDIMLMNQDQVYHIEKVFRQKECIFEMALCHVCAANLHRQYSKESKDALKKFFAEGYEPSSGTSHCHLCRSPAAVEQDRVLTATCARDRIVTMLVVVCSKCVERSQEVLSLKTKESYRDFIENQFPGVPAEWEPAPPVVVEH